MFYIYELWVSYEFLPFYVGMTLNIEKRHRAHLREGKKYAANKRWATMNEEKLKKIVCSNFNIQIKIVAVTKDKEEANRLEIETIAKYGRRDFGGMLTNMTDGGTGGYLVPQSADTARKKSEAMKKRISQMSTEQLQQWKEARGKGRKRAWAKLTPEEKLVSMKSNILRSDVMQQSSKRLAENNYYQDNTRKAQRSAKAKQLWSSLSEDERQKRLNTLIEGKKKHG